MKLVLDAQMIQELLAVLDECPAKFTRGMLNKIEYTIEQQNKPQKEEEIKEDK